MVVSFAREVRCSLGTKSSRVRGQPQGRMPRFADNPTGLAPGSARRAFSPAGGASKRRNPSRSAFLPGVSVGSSHVEAGADAALFCGVEPDLYARAAVGGCLLRRWRARRHGRMGLLNCSQGATRHAYLRSLFSIR